MTARIWKDRVQQTVSGTPGTGAFTLSTAVAGWQALVAGDDGKIGMFCATEGTAWETFIGTYTHSGTSLARTTRTDSSTGSAISFTAAAVVFLDIIATMAAQFDAPTNLITGTNAATTMVANATYVVDVSAFTADRIYTLPASPNVGDRVGVEVLIGSASYELILKGNTSQTINGGSAASEWSRLMMTGEYAVFRYEASNKWIVVNDGRIPIKVLAQRSAVSLVQNTSLRPNWDTTIIDNSSGYNAAGTYTYYALRRAGVFLCQTELLTVSYISATGVGIYSDIISDPNGSVVYYGLSTRAYKDDSVAGRLSGERNVVISVPVDTKISAEFTCDGTTGNAAGAELSIVEQLP